jgi:two-component system, chemotaxis family, chemotaxis protein CheY
MSGPTFTNLKALVVEDNAQMRALLRSLIYAVGIHDLYEAPSGKEAYLLFRDHSAIDLILTDLSMDGMDGITFTRKVRLSNDSPNPFVPIIMVTGHTERHRVVAARDAGVTEFLAKPITAHNLFRRIAEIVERPRPYIRSEDYFGPDRRRRIDDKYDGPWRRKEDVARTVVIP